VNDDNPFGMCEFTAVEIDTGRGFDFGGNFRGRQTQVAPHSIESMKYPPVTVFPDSRIDGVGK